MHRHVMSSPFPRWVLFLSGEQQPHCCSWYWTQRTGSHFCLRPTFPRGQYSSVTKTNFFLCKHKIKMPAWLCRPLVQLLFWVQNKTKTRRHVGNDTREPKKKTQLRGTRAKLALSQDKHFHNINCFHIDGAPLWKTKAHNHGAAVFTNYPGPVRCVILKGSSL